MKSRLTLLLLLIAFTTHAQDSYYHNQTQVGAGIGSNFVTIVGDNVKPTEISMRFRIHRHHTVQLIIPIFKQSDSFKFERHTTNTTRKHITINQKEPLRHWSRLRLCTTHIHVARFCSGAASRFSTLSIPHQSSQQTPHSKQLYQPRANPHPEKNQQLPHCPQCGSEVQFGQPLIGWKIFINNVINKWRHRHHSRAPTRHTVKH